ncbi:MAG: NADPH-dependent FMN reductase [Pseudomonadota bacterium]|nr:NADPH-dependent FMN reductase [Pseudomonadota bacterium]
MADTKVLNICGSLRKASINMAALQAASENAPDGMSLEIADLSGIPTYNDDVCQDDFPAAIETLWEQIRDVDVLLFATPEYNYPIPAP